MIERAASENLRSYVAAFSNASAVECAGGIAAFTGPESPLTTIKGAGPEITDRDIEKVTAFYRDCGAGRITFELAPWITASSWERLIQRGFERTGEESVVVCEPPRTVPEPGHPVECPDAETWAALLREASELPDEPFFMSMTRAAASLAGATSLGVRDDRLGWIGCAQMAPAGDVAIFANDATRAVARGRGVQTALIRERLRRASEFAWAIAEVAPGSVSESNYLRCGFRIAYVRTYYSIRFEST